MKYYIGADLGTSALKLLLTDGDGKIHKEVSKEYNVDYPAEGWSEQNPEDWIEAFKSGIKELTAEIGKDIEAICVAGQMHGLVILDESDKIIRPVILWNDGRCDKETEYLNDVTGKEKLSEMTGNIAFAGFTAPKLLWLKKNEPENFSAISKIMLPKDYINYYLTKVHSTDYSDASGTLLLDVKNKCWSQEMLSICNVKEEQMPKLFESYEITGTVSDKVAQELGFTSNVKVLAGTGDNAGAAIGTGTVADGQCNISIGTSGTIFISSDEFKADKNNALHSFCHATGKYHLMGCILSAASCNKWFCNEILKSNDYELLHNNITDTMLGENNVYFLPYLTGERSPINDTNARGLFIGMNPATKQEHMLLAVLEGVAFAIRDNMEIAKSLGINIKSCTVCGGGAKSKIWRKIICNVLGVPLDIPFAEEGPAYGGAILSAIACNEKQNYEENVKKYMKIKERVYTDDALVKKYNAKYKSYKKIYPSVAGLYKEIKNV